MPVEWDADQDESHERERGNNVDLTLPGGEGCHAEGVKLCTAIEQVEGGKGGCEPPQGGLGGQGRYAGITCRGETESVRGPSPVVDIYLPRVLMWILICPGLSLRVLATMAGNRTAAGSLTLPVSVRRCGP